MKKKPRLLLGAHMSIAGGLDKAIERAQSIDTTCTQLFTKNNRQWAARPIKKEEIELFKQMVKKSNIDPVVAHATYLINIGSPDNQIRKKSIQSLNTELQRCEDLEIPYIVLHPGSALSDTKEECIDRISSALNKILKQNPGKTMILLETMAGQGSNIGATFEELAAIYKKILPKKRIGYCLDTGHVFAAGYDFRTKKDYERLWKEFDKILGLQKLKVIQINDSKTGLGSRVDRHEHIGKGKLGLEPFKFLFNDPRFFDVPKILETPKEKDLKADIKNIKTIKTLLTDKTKKELDIEK